ncbi:MAG: phage tail assembly protein, partial [Martelella sp.]
SMETVKLSKSYTVNGTTFDTVELREPTYKDIYMDGLGKPFEWQTTPNGPVLLKLATVVDSYLQRLIKAPGYEFIHGLNAADSDRLEQAVIGFFTGAGKSSTGSATSSSSTSDGQPPKSSD